MKVAHLSLRWLVAYGVLTAGLYMLASFPSTGTMAAGIAWLAFISAFLLYGQQALANMGV